MPSVAKDKIDMKPVIEILEERISAAMADVTGQKGNPAIVKVTTDPKFGEYQANGIMALAKQIKTNPRKLAEQVVEKLDISDLCESPEIAGPGFINLRIKPEFIAESLLEINKDSENLAIEKTAKPKNIVVDFSGPNIAKEMHVGHLRSTIIGDCICRMLKFLRHNVIPQNHIGDWGTQFGRVILGLWHMRMAEEHAFPPYYQMELEKLKILSDSNEDSKRLCHQIRDRHEEDWRKDPSGEQIFLPFLMRLKLSKPDVEKLWKEFLCVYQYVNAIEEAVVGMGLTIPTIINGRETDIPYESLSRRITVMLQAQEDQEFGAWQIIRKLTLEHCASLYEKLGVKLSMADVRGESFYKDKLSDIVNELVKSGLAKESDGAMCVFPDGFKNKEGEPLPFIIQKSDGAYLYATTDLAAIRYRVNKLKADEIIYVTDSRQKLHFEMLFAVAREAGWAGDNVELRHVMFGSVLGENGQPLKTRSGENVKLKELIDEAVERAKAVVEQKNPELPAEQKDKIAQAVGIGAVKYADYSNNRTSDYVFSFDKMLAMEGNTAPYMQYAYARISSIMKKGNIDISKEIENLDTLKLNEPAELDLAKYLIRYGEAIQSAVSDFRPNYLTSYLYELAQKFSTFYTSCPVLKAEPDQRPTRLLLCDLTARTVRHGLTQLLGIEVVEQM